MTRTCSVCKHPKREEIEEAYRSDTSFTDISKKFGLSYWSTRNHHKQGHCLPVVNLGYIVPKELGELAEAVDGAREIEHVCYQARLLFFRWVQHEQDHGVVAKGTIQAMNVWRHAARDFFELIAKETKQPALQVSVIMPVLIKIVEGMPGHLKQEIYQYLQAIDVEEYDVLEELK